MGAAAAKFVQAGRRLAITSPLGEDVLLLSGLHVEEEMSAPFVGALDLLSEKASIDPTKIVGKAVSITLTLEEDKPRYFHGIVRSIESKGLEDRGLRRFAVEVVPWLWLLSLRTNRRIFQKLTAIEVVEKVFQAAGFADFEKTGVKRTCVKREYCVQYGETDLDFVSRLLEEEGVFYFFRHEQGKHVLVLADDKSAFKDCRESKVKFSDGTLDEPHVTEWTHRHSIHSGAFASADYDFKKPTTKLLATAKTKSSVPGLSKHEVYDYPGLFELQADGTALAKLRIEESEAAYSVVQGAGTCASFHVGGKFRLAAFLPDKSQENQGFVLTATVHHAVDESFATGDAQGEYWNSFLCIPDDVPYRPRRRTRKPVVEGPQTAVVVGPKGEEIYVDEHGRVKVQFHWDRDGKKNEESSCFVRVAQLWAGKKWGGHFWPRIGHEVVVDFLEGDPDRPLIVGSVYNADNMPPYALAANQTQSGIKTRSTKEGSEENFNEIRFEDKKGSEEVYVHAEKNMKRVVENDDVLTVGLEKKDKGDQTITVHNDRTITVKEGNETTTVEKGDELLEVKKGKRTLLVDEGDDLHQVKKGKRTLLVDTGDDVETVGKGDRTVTVDTGNDTHKVAKGNRAVEVSMGDDTLEIKMGNQTTKLALGKSTTEAMQSIELKVGANSVKIDQTGITIKGLMVKLEGTAMLSAKAPMTDVKGDGMLMLKGGITMIN